MTEIEKQLLIENNELRIRLTENEISLKRLQNGDAGTIVVPVNEGEKNAVLTSVEDPYRIILDEMNEGACTLSKEGTIFYCNQQLATFLSIPKEHIIGSKFSKLFARKDKTVFELISQTNRDGRSKGIIKYEHHHDIRKYFFLSLISLPPLLQGELFILFTDITDIKQNKLANEELLNSARLSALNIMEDEIAAKDALAKTNRKLIEEIRERKKAICTLQQTKHDLLQAQRMAHIGNWSYDLKSQQMTWSPEVFHIMGFDPNLPIPDHVEYKKLFPPDVWNQISMVAHASIEKSIQNEIEFCFQHQNGEVRTAIFIRSPQLNTEGKTIKLNGIIQDITDRKNSENELVKINRLYTVISQVNQMIVRNQLRENIFTEACNIVIEHGKFRMAWIGLLDEHEKNIIPITWAGAELGYLNNIKITATNSAEGNGPTGTAIRKGEYYHCNDIASDPNMEIWRDDALERNYRSSIALPISVFNKIIGAFTIYVSEPHFFNQAEIDLLLQVTTDISFALEVAETEKMRLQAEKALQKLNVELEQRVSLRTIQLEHTLKELEAFTYSVSHDLRSPLHNINGWSSILLEECKDHLGEKGSKYLDRVLMETKRMNNLIDDLLKLSKVTLVEKKKETVDLTAIAQKIVSRFQEKPSGHKFEFIIQPDLITAGDSRMLDIALTNLLDNAFKFSGKQDHARIEFGKSIMGGKPTYWVKDNGVGFDMANSKNLFGAFQRMHNQNDFPGTGIGLATVQRIIHRHNGIIWADSKINQGTTFYFTLPEDII